MKWAVLRTSVSAREIIDEENRSILLSRMTKHSITRDKKQRRVIYVSRWKVRGAIKMKYSPEYSLGVAQ